MFPNKKYVSTIHDFAGGPAHSMIDDDDLLKSKINQERFDEDVRMSVAQKQLSNPDFIKKDTDSITVILHNQIIKRSKNSHEYTKVNIQNKHGHIGEVKVPGWNSTFMSG